MFTHCYIVVFEPREIQTAFDTTRTTACAISSMKTFAFLIAFVLSDDQWETRALIESYKASSLRAPVLSCVYQTLGYEHTPSRTVAMMYVVDLERWVHVRY